MGAFLVCPGAAKLWYARLVGFLLRGFSVAAVAVIAVTLAEDARGQEVTSEARVHFGAGVNLLRDPAKPRYEEAYREFKAAYAIAPVTQILGNLGLCAMMLERDSEAIDAYEKYLKGMIELDPKEREQIERDLMTLKVGVTRVALSANVKGTTLIDQRVRPQGESVTNVYGPIDEPKSIGIRQGHHIMIARAPGHPEVTWEVDATAGQMEPHVFELSREAMAPPIGAPPPPAAERPIPRSFWYAAGGTGLLAVATTVTGLVAMGARSSYRSANDGRSPERAESLQSDAKTLNVTTDILLTGTLLGAALTAFIYLGRPEKAPAAAALGAARYRGLQ